jgi:hypothetical protein
LESLEKVITGLVVARAARVVAAAAVLALALRWAQVARPEF